jgi:phosphate:Na+ symporter
MGFALIFYGLNLMTGGLKPLRNIPEVMSAISTLKADNLLGLIYCIVIAAFITAMIHSSSATIGIVMGLGSAGVLDWQTAVAFSLGADLGTTITSWMASLNLSKNAKRTAYAHISFNIIGVMVMIPLFFPSMLLLTWVMGWFGGDPSVPVIVNGKETFPLVPVAVGLYSTAFNIFNTALMFPFIGVFDRVLSKIGHTSVEDKEDFSQPRFLDPRQGSELATGVPLVRKELARYVEATGLFLATARKQESAPDDVVEHSAAIDVLNRDIRNYTAAMFKQDLPHAQADLLASLIEEEDFTASLGETLYQAARRVERQPFSDAGRGLVNAVIDQISHAMSSITDPANGNGPADAQAQAQHEFLLSTRAQCLKLGASLPWEERGAVLALLGSAERAFFLIERIRAERKSVSREVDAPASANASGFPGGGLVQVLGQ